MKLRQFQCVLAVVQNGYNVTAAAEALYMSQPAVSKQIKLLEDTLGMQVFKRNSKSFVGLTPLGDALMPEIDRILQGVDNIYQLGKQSQEERFSQLHVATTNTLAYYCLVNTLPYMQKTYPKMPLNILEGTNTQILQWVQNQDADFAWFSAMSLTPYESVLRQLIYLPATGWDLTAIVPKTHQLAHQAPKTLADIAQYPLITYVTSHKGPSGLVAAMLEVGLTPRVTVTARNAEMIKGYVRQGMGVGVIADIAYEYDKDSDLVAYSLSAWVNQVQTYLAWHETKRLRAVHYDFIEQIVPDADQSAVQNHIRRIQIGKDVEGWAI